MDEPRQQSDQLPQRLMKYLPLMMAGHLFITIPAFVISLALAYATFVQADATRKIQRSETWPYVSYGTSNIAPDGATEILFSLSNDGVGPARLKAIEFIYDGRPMANPRNFLQQCCGDRRESPTSFMSAPINGVIRPGQSINFIRLPKRPDNAIIWDRLEVERWKITVRACYCSIFDDCWILDSRKQDPQPVEACPPGWKSFEERPYPSAAAPAAI
jgi:hypothetical protein